ncbi:MAG: hypothetical protein JKX73_09570, partial [Flavobacteriales bacterium]|nr:hypothetical protein [Flavobacteriales bacterium]
SEKNGLVIRVDAVKSKATKGKKPKATGKKNKPKGGKGTDKKSAKPGNEE